MTRHRKPERSLAWRALPVATLLLSACRPAASVPPQETTVPGARGTPSLVVLVVVDQLRGDLMERYDDLFEGGFRRILDEGFRFTRATHDHAYTETAAGHATLMSGVYPSRHGIVANDWVVERDGRWWTVYSVEDPDSPVLGAPELEGRSPRNLLRGGLADWVVDGHPGARVVTVSAKDRSAITLAGRVRGHTYWMDKPRARVVTSRYYRDGYPSWIEDFNREVMPGAFADSVWRSAVPRAAAQRSRADTAWFEGDGVHTWFTHRFAEESSWSTPVALATWAGRGPRPDQVTLDLAVAAMDALDLGRSGSLDYLGISFSQVDYVGHDYGPLSREQLDNLLRLDRVLGRLFDELDRRVGPGGWVAALSADHGVLDVPEWRVTQGLPGDRFGSPARTGLREAVLEAVRAGEDGVAVAEASPFVARAYSRRALAAGVESDSFAVLFGNALVEDRWPGPLSMLGVEIRATEGTLLSDDVRGTTHGSPYWYDRWVPLAFLGAGVEKGSSPGPAATVDLAPTLAALAGVTTPGDLDGRVLPFRGAR